MKTLWACRAGSAGRLTIGRRLDNLPHNGVLITFGGPQARPQAHRPANVSRVLGALEELDAIYRAQPDLRLRPKASHLSSAGHQLLITRFGPLDLLGSIGNGRTYRDLLTHSTELKADATLLVRVLDLETQIAIKEEVGGEKDRAALPILRRTLQEHRER